MGQPLTLNEIGVAPEDAAQVIFDLRREIDRLNEVADAEGDIAFRHYDMLRDESVCTTCGAMVRHGFRSRHAAWHRGESQQTDVNPTDEVR